jgi:hypothetical protein
MGVLPGPDMGALMGVEIVEDAYARAQALSVLRVIAPAH